MSKRASSRLLFRACWSASLIATLAHSASACVVHEALVAPTLATASSSSFLQPTNAALGSGDAVVSSAPLTAWKLNLTGATGTSPDATINSLVSSTLADVQQVRFDASYAYVKITNVPSHSVGPFVGNPAYPAKIDRTLRITRSPVEAATKTSTGMGPIGLMSNGVFLFNATDARSYNNANVWMQNANVVEAPSFDAGRGHPAPLMNTTGNPRPGQYHYHQSPKALIDQLDPNNTGQHHSPLIGYAFDGFPIYGPFGYSDPTDPTSAIKRLDSGYKLRDDVLAGARTTLVDGGPTLTAAQSGPAVNATYIPGYYLQDFEYVTGGGDLNQYNMRWTVTPDYPEGTWAYVATADASGAASYPYLVGPQFFGVVDTANSGNGSVTVPTTATTLRAGDANADGSVNFADLVALAQNYNRAGATRWADGDFNRDGKVVFADLVLLAQNYGQPSSFTVDWALAQAAVPEPMSLTLLPLAGIALRRRR